VRYFSGQIYRNQQEIGVVGEIGFAQYQGGIEKPCYKDSSGYPTGVVALKAPPPRGVGADSLAGPKARIAHLGRETFWFGYFQKCPYISALSKSVWQKF
jgi:hypothetical protein